MIKNVIFGILGTIGVLGVIYFAMIWQGIIENEKFQSISAGGCLICIFFSMWMFHCMDIKKRE